MAIIFNKITYVWTDIEDPETLTNPEDWVVNPVFENRAAAQEVGAKYWKFDGNVIKVMTVEDIDASPTHLAAAKAKKTQEIEDVFEARHFGAFTFAGHEFPATDAERKVIGQAASFADMSLSGGMEWPSGFYLKDLAGESVELSAEEVLALNSTMFKFSYACFQSKWSLLRAVNDALTTSAVLAIDAESGWPVHGVDYSDATVPQRFVNARRPVDTHQTLHGGADPYVKRSNKTYSTLARHPFEGTAQRTPAAMTVIVQVVGGGTGSIRVQDMSNGKTIAELTNISAGQFTTMNMGALANLPVEPTIFEIQAKTSSNSTEIRLSGITFIY
jgi:hypothetical protein